MKDIYYKFVGYQMYHKLQDYLFPASIWEQSFLGNIVPIFIFLPLKGFLTLSSPTKSVMYFLSNGSIRSGKKVSQ